MEPTRRIGAVPSHRVGPDAPSEPTINPESLRAARLRKELTQHQLARLIGVAGGERISRWELGTSAPRPELLIRLAAVLDIRPVDILTPHPGPPDLRRIRVLAGLSAQELARQAHVSVANVQRWETGRIERIPPRSILERLASVLAVQPSDVEEALQHSRDLHWTRPT